MKYEVPVLEIIFADLDVICSSVELDGNGTTTDIPDPFI